VAFNSYSKTEVTAQLKLSKNAAEINSAKSAGKQAKATNKKASGRVPNMRTSRKNVVLAAAVLAGLSFFSGQFGFSSEKVKTHTVSA
jgi:hypothetical protein